VRELKNAIERAVLLSEGDVLGPKDFQLAPTVVTDAYTLPPGGIDLAQLERDLVRQALERTRGNQTRAAELVGMNRDQIRHRIEKFGLQEMRSVPGGRRSQ
jgi:two-component system, NtrC family, response regulator AtoC